MIDKSEIIISFRSAKDKERQIKVLSDLNCVSPREIADILDEAGELKKAGLTAKTFSSVYHAVPAAKSPQREGPKATRKRSGSVPPLDEIRAMELFNVGMDDVAISEALGVSVTRIRKWRSRMRLLRPRGGAAKNKKQSKEESMEKNNSKETSRLAPEPPYKLSAPPPPVDSQTPETMTVDGFLALLGMLLAPALDAELSINGERVNGIFSYEVTTRGKLKFVDVRTREG